MGKGAALGHDGTTALRWHQLALQLTRMVSWSAWNYTAARVLWTLLL